METRGPKSNLSKLLCLSWLPATLMMIRSKMNELQYSSTFFSISLQSQWVIKLSGRIKKCLPLFDSTHFGGNTAMKTQVFFSEALSGIAEEWLESYVLYLAWPEWKGLKFYSPLWFHPFGWKQVDCRGITGWISKNNSNVWEEPWVGLKGANKPAHWDGWETENPLELYCSMKTTFSHYKIMGNFLDLKGS